MEYSIRAHLIRRYLRTVKKIKSPASALQRRGIDFEDDPEFLDFIESISVTKEELAAIVSRPRETIPEIRQNIRAKRR